MGGSRWVGVGGLVRRWKRALNKVRSLPMSLPPNQQRFDKIELFRQSSGKLTFDS